MPNDNFQSTILFSILLLALTSSPFAAFTLRAQQPASNQEPKTKLQPISSHVIVISISGLRSDFIASAGSPRPRLPTIGSLRTKGAYAVGVESVFPSLTNPAHATIVTGALPADHGITSDYPFDEKLGVQSQAPRTLAKEIRTDTLWELTRRANLVTAAIGYPLTVGAAINFNLPDASEESSELRSEVLSGSKSGSRSGLAAKPGGGNNQDFIQSEDAFKADAAAYLIEKYRPNLLMINFTSFDAAQRQHGLLSEKSIGSLELIDGFIKKIVAAAERARTSDETTFIIVSDYGAAKIEREFKPNVALAEKGWLTLNAQGQIAAWRAVAQTFGGSAAIFVNNPRDENFVKEVEDFLRRQYEKPDSPIWRVIPRRDAARLGTDPRAALYLDAAPSYAMSDRATGAPIVKAAERTAHGYSPSRSEMRATLIVSGKGAKSGVKLEYARLIDIAPTVARLFGLEMKTARGRVLAEAINQ